MLNFRKKKYKYLIILKKFKNTNSFLSNVLKVASGTLLAQALGYIFLPLITRLYTPQQFGDLGIFIAMFGVFTPLLGGKFEIALVLEKDKIQKMNLYLLSAVITLFISIISFFVFLFFRDNIISILSLSINQDLLFILPASLLFFGLYQANKYLLISNNSFGEISKTIVIEKIVNIGSKLIIGFFKPSSFGLVFSDLLGKIAVVFYTYFAIIQNKLYVSVLKKFNKYEVVKLVKKYKKFPTYELAGDWFDSISNQIPLLIMAFYFNSVIIGYYVFANSILKKIIMLTSKSFGSVYYQKISEIKVTERNAFTSKLIKNLSIIGILPFIIIAIGAPEIFSFIFGENWYNSGIYAQIMSPYLMIFFFLKPINGLYRVYNQQDKLFYFNIVNFIIFSGVVIIGGLMKDITLTIKLISISGVLVYGWIYFWILQKIKITFLDFIKLIKKYLLISFGFLLIPLLIKIFNNNDVYFLFSLLLLSIGYYLYVYKYSKMEVN
jgi:O-antigen/teichoic acid export membrane protein